MRPVRAAPATTTCHIYPSCLVFSPLSLSHPTTSFLPNCPPRNLGISEEHFTFSSNEFRNEQNAGVRPSRERDDCIGFFKEIESNIQSESRASACETDKSGPKSKWTATASQIGFVSPPPFPLELRGSFFREMAELS